jgi:CO/xanthine dehydrogenase FAD-binding subunit
MPLEIVRAATVREAVALLAEEAGARYLAGGTLAVREWSGGDVSISRFVLSDDLGLGRIEVAAGRAEIGSATTMAEIAKHRGLAFLHDAAASIGGPAVRAMATVGGNLFAPYPYGDLAVALLVLDANISVADQRGERIEPIEGFLAKKPLRGTIVTGVSFAVPPAERFRFIKVVRRRPHSAPVLSIAAFLPLEKGVVRGARIAFGAMAPRPMRARGAEAALEGRALEQQAAKAAAERALEGCAPQDDPFASAWYRAAVLPVYLQRLLGG